ncbi:MAG: preprotein translocase subunit SecG [Planctomycetota bacterium]
MMYLAYSLLTLHMIVGIFLIGLILLQRGRGGGLAGSFGGMGGQSAFGTKAGDIFTRITIVVAVIWILLACACILVVSAATKGRFKPGAADAVIKAPVIDDKAGAKGDAAGDDKATIPPGLRNTEQPAGDEKKPGDKKDDGAAETKNPAAANPDAPAGAKEKAPADPKENDAKEGDKDKPEKSEKQPE